MPFTQEQKPKEINHERERCIGIVEAMRDEWVKHTHQDAASRLLIEMLGKCAARIREDQQPTFALDMPTQCNDDWPSDYLEQFWRAFPARGRVSKIAVAKKLGLLRKGKTITFARLLGAVERYTLAKQGSDYIANALTWLNHGRWADDSEALKPTDGLTGFAAVAMHTLEPR